MQVLKWVAVLVPVALAVFLGGIAFAWRRALVHLGKQLFGRLLTPTSLRLIIPPFVALQERWALTLLLVAVVVAFALFGWEVAVGTLAATYLFMLLSRYAHSGPTHPYYLQQLVTDLQSRLRIADHFGDGKTAKQLKSRLEVLEEQLPERLAQQAAKERFWRQKCANPLVGSFAAMYERLPQLERMTIDEKAIQVTKVCRDVITKSSPARAECERRRMAALLLANYSEELGGDFSASTPKERDTVVTLLATGLTYEKMLTHSAPSVLSEVFADDERSPLNLP